VLEEKTEGLFTVNIGLEMGDITAANLAAVAEIAGRFGSGPVRTTQLQDLLITSVPRDRIEAALSALGELGPARGGGCKIVTCTGAATCKLGLCLSRGLAAAVAEKLRGRGVPPGVNSPTIRISGCPNSCGHHCIAGIGFQGRARRVNGRLMPCYDVVAGAVVEEGKARLAEAAGTVPARAVPGLIAELLAGGPAGAGRLKELVGRRDPAAGDFEDEYYLDWGSTEPFSLAGRGPGECGAGVMDVIRVDIDEAAASLEASVRNQPPREKSRHLYSAVAAAARALLVIFGVEPKTDREAFAAFEKHLIAPGWAGPQARALLEKAVDWRMGDSDSIVDLSDDVDKLVRRVKTLFLSLDGNLKFTAAPVSQETDGDTEAKGNVIDLRGVECPLNFVKAKLRLERIEAGGVLEVLLDGGEPVRNVPASFAEQGQEVIEVADLGGYFSVKVRKKK
jgi:sulfite reductase (ferredoxin)